MAAIMLHSRLMQASLRRLPEKRVTEHTFADADSENNQPVIRLGGVVFKGKPATPSIRPMLKVVVNADEPARTEMMKLERNVATEWLGRSETLLPMKHRRRHIMRRVARKEAQRREPLGPEFLGFNSHPNPSYDPFTDVDSRSEASRPRKALIELLKKHSSRSASRTATPSDSDHPFEPGSSVEVTRMGPSDSAPHGFDPFAPLIKTEEATTQLSSSETSTDSAEQGYLESSQEAVDPSDELDNSFDFDYFAAAEPVPEPHHIRPAVLNSDAECIDHKLQSFDPFHPDQPDHSLDPFAPLSSNLNLEHIPRRPSLSTNSAHKPATRSSAAFRAGSSERLKNLDVGLYEKKPIMISWRALRKRRPGP
ncbi:hypothetical protein H0H87_002307 [Tephrocybe sp. NHM501043]|nr:hypothetical protein H0H87_002307 [Tephrocybe sp. NHM501043]